MARSMLNFNFQANPEQDPNPVQQTPDAIPEEKLMDADPSDLLQPAPVPAAPVYAPEPVPAAPPAYPAEDAYQPREEPSSYQPVKRRNSRRSSEESYQEAPARKEPSPQELYASAFPSWDLMPPQVLIRRVSRKK